MWILSVDGPSETLELGGASLNYAIFLNVQELGDNIYGFVVTLNGIEFNLDKH